MNARAGMMVTLALAVGLVTTAHAQRGGFGGGFGGVGGRPYGGQIPLAPELPGPELDGPPDSATATALFGLRPEEATRYAQARDSFMVSTRPQRDSATTMRDEMNAKLDDGDRDGAMYFAERLQRLGKTLKDRQNKFEDGLSRILTADEIKEYKKWKKDEEQAADDRRRQDARRWYPERGGRAGVEGGAPGRGFGGGGYDGPVEQKTAVETRAPKPELGSAVIRVGRDVYVTGQVATDSSGKIVGEGDLATQARQAFANLTAALSSARSGPADVLRLTIYVVNYDPKDIDIIHTAGSPYFAGRNPPVVTVVGVQSLSRTGLLISVEATALSNIVR
ncbi:MAG: RidA family protein [Gemmatimonadetes bacterium]|nr:RidA family protein [Gemmatimonadota bacterium]